ncbi:MAG: type VI secretion system lipoprotein TssJ [Gammaproteobacteria bacterium]|uniref:type VI secretion system lipoprotein TssJ n=1 Tax=unclassified Pseudacidovorax TaxID=2620592 RepID=UPI001B529FA8|nr:type VI secretion system lipoprotein TssJ [Pseudacidovorax sp.]MBP6897964.1 type VI secretion system lipoprotein TssJ [Pseudacidovorax sp.]
MQAPSPQRSSYGRLARRSLGRGLLAGAVLGPLLLAGCAAPPPPPPKPIVTPVVLNLKGGADANPDARGRASPVTVRVYALKASQSFDAADFFTLFDKDQATLGGDLVQKEELLLRPGDSRRIEMTLPADAKALAFMAAYRDLERARWREVRPVEPGKPVKLDVTFGARQIRIEPSTP